MNKKEYFKIAKIWTSTLLFFLTLFLAGCSSTNNIEKSYNLKEDIKGTELTFEDLKNEINKINLNKSLYPYGQIKAYGVSDLIDEIADNDNGSEELIIKYDFSSGKLEDIKIYVEAKTSLNSYQAFINDGFNYYNFKTNGKEHKGKKAILFSDYILPYKEIFEKVIEVIELPILDGELNNQLLD